MSGVPSQATTRRAALAGLFVLASVIGACQHRGRPAAARAGPFAAALACAPGCPLTVGDVTPPTGPFPRGEPALVGRWRRVAAGAGPRAFLLRPDGVIAFADSTRSLSAVGATAEQWWRALPDGSDRYLLCRTTTARVLYTSMGTGESLAPPPLGSIPVTCERVALRGTAGARTLFAFAGAYRYQPLPADPDAMSADSVRDRP